ncbi:olfactory receptor 5AR1-like [Rhinoderma darwinii]|uniref:olfactory receptor 5AR1-like n=1 Tax=Rhinoderma darwinii TaxID=43563 RepID=UPI003F66C3D9
MPSGTLNPPEQGRHEVPRMKSEESLNRTDFIFEGLTHDPMLQYIFLVVFLIIYFIIICGNGIIFLVIWQDSRLHTPMYIFLLNLSVIDIASTSNILPKLLIMIFIKYNTISFGECITQLYLFILFVCTEVFLLAAMAYDRYLAICYPFQYIIIMSLKHTAGLSIMAWTVGLLSPVGHVTLISRMSFCASHVLSHFYCDISPLLRISCSDIHSVEMLTYAVGTLVGILTLIFTLLSYIFIILKILTIKSPGGRGKAFSTCSSHLTCVIMFYGTIMCLHMRPTSTYSLKIDKCFSLVYAALVPMLNPFIYSLKNEEVKKGLRKLKTINKKLLSVSALKKTHDMFYISAFFAHHARIEVNGVTILSSRADKQLTGGRQFRCGEFCGSHNKTPLCRLRGNSSQAHSTAR